MMLDRAHSPVIAVAFVLVAMALAGCFGTNQEDHSEQAVEDCRVDHCIEEAVEDCRVDHCIEEAVEDCRVDHCIEVTIDAIECPEEYDNMRGDNVCLAYNGQIPGPTWVFHEGELVEITLVHNVTKSIQEMNVDEEFAEHLSEARYTMHRHGISQDECSDGVAQPVSTDVCDSTVGPGESVTYTFNATFPGYWHYHDHAHTFNTEAAHQPVLGGEGVQRGLWGSFLVLSEGETTDHVFGLHVLDKHGEVILEAGVTVSESGGVSVNGGLGLQETVQEGDRFDIIATGLGSRQGLESVALIDPDGTLVAQHLIGPGVSRGLTVLDANPGTYTWAVLLPVATELEEYAFSALEEYVLAQGEIEVLENGATTGTDPDQEGAAGNSVRMDDPIDRLRHEPDRTFVIPFDLQTSGGHASARSAAGDPPMGLPILEASVGEKLEFHVVNTDFRAPHTFHLHGHPWTDPDTGMVIDTVPLQRGDLHSFTVTAGLEAGHHGEWLYHCHISHDINMWSVLRVYPHSMDVAGPMDDLLIAIHDANGIPVAGASMELRWNPDAPPDPTLTSIRDEQSVPATITEQAPGIYTVRPELPPGATGELVIESIHETGNSLTRLTLLPDGSWEENQDVGLDFLDDLPPTHSDLKENILS